MNAHVARCDCGRCYSRREWYMLPRLGTQEAPAAQGLPALKTEVRECVSVVMRNGRIVPCKSTISAEAQS